MLQKYGIKEIINVGGAQGRNLAYIQKVDKK